MFIIIHISYAMTFGTFYNFHFRVNCHKFLPFKREVNYSIDFNFRFRCDPLFLEIKRKHCKFFTNVSTFRVYVNEIEYPFKGKPQLFTPRDLEITRNKQPIIVDELVILDLTQF